MSTVDQDNAIRILRRIQKDGGLQLHEAQAMDYAIDILERELLIKKGESDEDTIM